MIDYKRLERVLKDTLDTYLSGKTYLVFESVNSFLDEEYDEKNLITITLRCGVTKNKKVLWQENFDLEFFENENIEFIKGMFYQHLVEKGII